MARACRLEPVPLGSRWAKAPAIAGDSHARLLYQRPTVARPVVVAPSILSADFGRLAEEVRDIERAGADLVHVDVMDGQFVPNITLGPPIVAAVKRVTSLPLDVHLMIVQPERYIEAFVAAGASILSVHAEACVHLERTLAEIRRLGCRAGVVLNPATHESVLEYALHVTDVVLVMSVNPGFGGQAFLPSIVPKIRRVAEMVRASGRDIAIEVDGGVTDRTAKGVLDAGAEMLVAGSYVFGAKDREHAIRSLKALA